MTKRKKKGFLDYFLTFIMIAAFGVFLYAGYNLFIIYNEYEEGEDTYEQLQEYVQDNTEKEQEPISGEDVPKEEIPLEAQIVLEAPITVDFQQLKAVNEDIVGWLYMEAIPEISYPIVQGTDNEYYLKHTVEGKRNSSASIFMDYQNSEDYSDKNTIVYGHNMKNQSMFGRLKRYKKEEVCATSPYFWILTPEQDYRYELFAVREIGERNEVFSLYEYTTEEFKTYLETAQAESLISFSHVFDGTEKVVTLSTCTSNAVKRCVVQGFRRE